MAPVKSVVESTATPPVVYAPARSLAVPYLIATLDAPDARKLTREDASFALAVVVVVND